jgi:CheY-like chemotaxis protein
MTGEEVLNNLRGESDTASLPVVVLSADATKPQKERLATAGANAYLTKPISVVRLLQTLDEFLASEQPLAIS